MSTEEAALDQAPTPIVDQSTVPKTKLKAKTPPDKFTYALQQFTVQRRKSGWWITHDGIEYAVIISQIRLFSTRRLRRRIFRMPEDMFGEMLSALQQMIGQGT